MDKKDTKILFIEDDPMLSKIYQKKFGSLGYQVFAAADGGDGLQKAKEIAPHIIVLDLMLPEKNGFDVLANLKQDATLQSIPVVIVSNLGQANDIERCTKLGAVDFIVKNSAGLEEITKRVEKILSTLS